MVFNESVTVDRRLLSAILKLYSFAQRSPNGKLSLSAGSSANYLQEKFQSLHLQIRKPKQIPIFQVVHWKLTLFIPESLNTSSRTGIRKALQTLTDCSDEYMMPKRRRRQGSPDLNWTYGDQGVCVREAMTLLVQ